MTSPAFPAAAQGALTAAAQAERLAAYGYGTLGARLREAGQIALARQCEQSHQDLAARADGLAPETVPQPTSTTSPGSYALPTRVTDENSARLLAVQLEEACARAWRLLLVALASATVDGPATFAAWPVAVTALRDSAVRAVRWRLLTDPGAPSTPFPGI
jgi:hypothetical protein